VSLTARDVDEILRLLDQSAFSELVLETGGLKIQLRRGDAPKSNGSFAAPSTAVPRSAHPAQVAKAPPPPEGLVDVPAPLLGVYYRAPKPGEPPFVEVGHKVEEETIVGIIEVMKLMNSVRAGMRGEIVEIFAQNAALVEFGEPLLRVRPGG